MFLIDCKMVPPLLEKVWQFLISLKILLTIHSAVLPGVQIRETKASAHEKVHISMFLADLFIRPHTGNQSGAHEREGE